MRNLVVFGIIALFTQNCGTGFDGKSSTKKNAIVASQTKTVCDINGANCHTEIVTIDDGKDPSQSGVVYTSTPTYGAGMPSSYTMLDTPNANLCVDAFNRMGIDLPDNTVARSFNSFNVRANGIAWQDMGESLTPVMNILDLSSTFSNVIFQMLNPVGFYCIVKNDAKFSNVTMQKRCSAVVAQLEPMTVVTVNEPVRYKPFHWLPWNRSADLSGTTTSYNSEIKEVPCIQ
jgi:hypothetical protein